MKEALVMMFFILTMACAQKPDPAKDLKPQPSEPTTPADENQILAEGCSVKFLKTMNLTQIMVASDQMHRDCDYSEEQVLSVVRFIFEIQN
jgi:hypothetical protein